MLILAVLVKVKDASSALYILVFGFLIIICFISEIFISLLPRSRFIWHQVWQHVTGCPGSFLLVAGTSLADGLQTPLIPRISHSLSLCNLLKVVEQPLYQIHVVLKFGLAQTHNFNLFLEAEFMENVVQNL